jgi:hypothetical protein
MMTALIVRIVLMMVMMIMAMGIAKDDGGRVVLVEEICFVAAL